MATFTIELRNSPNVIFNVRNNTNFSTTNIVNGGKATFDNAPKYNLNLEPASGYVLKTAKYSRSTGTFVDIPISVDGLTATTVLTGGQYPQGSTAIVMVTVEIAPDPEPEPEPEPVIIKMKNDTETITVTAENLTTNVVTSIPFGVETELDGSVNYKVIGRSITGYEIVYGSYVSYTSVTQSLTPLEDNRIEVEIDASKYGTRVFKMSAETAIIQPPQKVSGFNFLYLVDNDVLKLLARERFEKTSTGDVVDLGQYIINVMELPFSLNPIELGLETDVVLGYVITKTKTIELRNDEIVIDFGDIEVPLKYNNSYDYMNTSVRLHVPFSDTIDVDINYAVGKTIRVVYIIDLYSGETTINIYSSLIDNIFLSTSASIGRNIPFVTSIKGDKLGTLSNNRSLTNGLLKPFVEVVRNTPYQVDNIFNPDVTIQGTLQGVTGFVRVNSIILNSIATINEKQSITNILKNGVVIK